MDWNLHHESNQATVPKQAEHVSEPAPLAVAASGRMGLLEWVAALVEPLRAEQAPRWRPVVLPGSAATGVSHPAVAATVSCLLVRPGSRRCYQSPHTIP